MTSKEIAPGYGLPTVSILGRGRAGSGLAAALRDAGVEVSGPWGRETAPARAAAEGDLLILAVRDREVAALALELAAAGASTPTVHLGGAMGRDLMAPLAASAEVGAWHPFYAFGRARPDFHGAAFAIDAAGTLRERLVRLTETLGAFVIEIPPGGRPLYHAAAVMVAAYVVTLGAASQDLLRELGVEEGAARAAVIGLARSALDNLAVTDASEALSGPVVRGDTATLLVHLQALAEARPDLLDAYRELGLLTAALARRSGRLQDADAALVESVMAGTAARTVGGKP
ncbi:MAG: DUF2520 domain-containing protein [Candidatus Dormibacteria bacterium]